MKYIYETSMPAWLYEVACGNCRNVSSDIPDMSDHTMYAFFIWKPCEEYAELYGCEADYI